MIRTALGKALDVQGHAVRQALTHESDTDKQMTKIRHAIPGMDYLYNNVMGPDTPEAGPSLGPLDAPIHRVHQVLSHAARGLVDSTIEGALDPLTYETYGFGPALKALGISEKVAPLLMKGINSNAVTQSIHDALQWGGAAGRAGHDVPMLRGAGNLAKSSGSIVQRHIMERVNTIVTPLDDEERLNVGRALNGQETNPLTTREQSAFRQLRTLTNLDYAFRRNAARTIIQHNNPGLSEESVNAMLDQQVPRRENYMPSAHTGETQAEGRTAYTRNPTGVPRSAQLAAQRFLCDRTRAIANKASRRWWPATRGAKLETQHAP